MVKGHARCNKYRPGHRHLCPMPVVDQLINHEHLMVASTATAYLRALFPLCHAGRALILL